MFDTYNKLDKFKIDLIEVQKFVNSRLPEKYNDFLTKKEISFAYENAIYRLISILSLFPLKKQLKFGIKKDVGLFNPEIQYRLITTNHYLFFG